MEKSERDIASERPEAENPDSESADSLPGAPADDDAPAGDTDQHSDSDA